MDGQMPGWVNYDKQAQIPLNRQGLGLGPRAGAFTWAFLVFLVALSAISWESNRAPGSCPPSPWPSERQTELRVPSWSILRVGAAGLWPHPGPRPRRSKCKGLPRTQAGPGVGRPWPLTLLGAAEPCPPSCPATSLPEGS